VRLPQLQEIGALALMAEAMKAPFGSVELIRIMMVFYDLLTEKLTTYLEDTAMETSGALTMLAYLSMKHIPVFHT
jgi:hypothetical protein